MGLPLIITGLPFEFQNNFSINISPDPQKHAERQGRYPLSFYRKEKLGSDKLIDLPKFPGYFLPEP